MWLGIVILQNPAVPSDSVTLKRRVLADGFRSKSVSVELLTISTLQVVFCHVPAWNVWTGCISGYLSRARAAK